MPATISRVRGATRSGSMVFADSAFVGFAGLNPPPEASGVGVIVTSFGWAKWSPLRSRHGYSAQPWLPLGFAYPTVPVSNCVTYWAKLARTSVLRDSVIAYVRPARGEKSF